jgi:hypothetical protein
MAYECQTPKSEESQKILIMENEFNANALDKQKLCTNGMHVIRTRRFINLSNRQNNSHIPHKRKHKRGDRMIENMQHMTTNKWKQ